MAQIESQAADIRRENGLDVAETHNGRPLAENERVENIDGVDFVFTQVGGEQLSLENETSAKSELFMVVDNVSRSSYNIFALAFPQIANGSYQDMTFRNEETKQELSVYHDTTTAGLVHFTISSYAPNASMVYDPMVTFRANFENRMLTPIQYANTVRGVDIGYLSAPSPDDKERLEAESIGIYETLLDVHLGVKTNKFEMKNADPFMDAQGNPLPAEPKPNFTAFLEERAKRESAAHFYVQSNMFNTAEGTPLWQDYQAISAQHSDHVLFYRLGDFYEVLGENAPVVAEELGLSVVSRDVGLSERVPLIGVPEHALDGYLQTLEEKGFNIAVRHGHGDVEIRSEKQSPVAELTEWQKTIEDIASDTENYTEPFVVIEFMEGGEGHVLK